MRLVTLFISLMGYDEEDRKLLIHHTHTFYNHIHTHTIVLLDKNMHIHTLFPLLGKLGSLV